MSKFCRLGQQSLRTGHLDEDIKYARSLELFNCRVGSFDSTDPRMRHIAGEEKKSTLHRSTAVKKDLKIGSKYFPSGREATAFTMEATKALSLTSAVLLDFPDTRLRDILQTIKFDKYVFNGRMY